MIGTERSAEGHEYERARHSYLLRLALPAQKRVVQWATIPIAALHVYPLFYQPCWQNTLLLVAVVLMLLCWLLSVLQARKGRLERSVLMFALPVVFFIVLKTLLIENLLDTAALAYLTALAYVSIFSRRHLAYVTALVLVCFLVSAVVQYYEPYDILTIPARNRLLGLIFMAVLILPVFSYVLRRGQVINEFLFAQMKQRDAAQMNIAVSASAAHPVISSAVQEIDAVSKRLAAQSSEQAAALVEASTTMGKVNRVAEETARFTKKTGALGKVTSREAAEASRLLQAVERGFQEVVEEMDSTRDTINQLASHIENIDEITGFNRTLGEQIKVLAINASIEASSAGQHGLGFAVVASELNDMIRETSANLDRSQSSLREIREFAEKSLRTTERSTELLGRHFEELLQAIRGLESIGKRFAETLTGVEKISRDALGQQADMSEVSVAIRQLDEAASQLSESAAVLVVNVKEIIDAYDSVKQQLEPGGE